MKKELDQKLVENFPLLYTDRNGSYTTTLMCWGFSVGNGWYDIIYNLSEKLEKCIQKYIDENPGVTYPRAMQVKEKFGTLRFYMTFETDEMLELIMEAEEKSASTCEGCGQPGSSCNPTSFWIKTLCQDCIDKGWNCRDDQD